MSGGFKVSGEVFWGTNGAVEAYVETMAADAAARFGPGDPLSAYLAEQTDSFTSAASSVRQAFSGFSRAAAGKNQPSCPSPAGTPPRRNGKPRRLKPASDLALQHNSRVGANLRSCPTVYNLENLPSSRHARTTLDTLRRTAGTGIPFSLGAAMGDHYVPRKYLRGFCEPGSEDMLWQYDKQRGQFNRVSVATIANERRFYSPDVEAKLASLVENPANAAIDKLRHGTTIDAADREHLALYIATMIKRVPRSRQLATDLMPQALADTVNALKELISRATSENRLDAGVAARRLAETDAAAERFMQSPPPEVIEQIRIPWPTPEMVALVFGMTWRFVTTVGPSYFLTSDNPAFIFEGLGLAGPGAELTFPISTKLALHGSWQPGPSDTLITTDQKTVKELNRRIARTATRFLYYHERQDWIASVCQQNEQSTLNRINWC
jgi:hypothetical protein